MSFDKPNPLSSVSKQPALVKEPPIPMEFSYFVYQHFDKFAIPIFFGLLFTAAAMRFGMLSLLCALLNVFIIFNTYEYYRKQVRQSLVFPAIVVSVEPFLIAVYANLSTTDTPYPVVKIISSANPNQSLYMGQWLGAACHFSGQAAKMRWQNVHPILLNCLTSNDEAIKKAMSDISPEEWALLEKGIDQLNAPYQEGLYRIKNQFDSSLN